MVRIEQAPEVWAVNRSISNGFVGIEELRRWNRDVGPIRSLEVLRSETLTSASAVRIATVEVDIDKSIGLDGSLILARLEFSAHVSCQ